MGKLPGETWQWVTASAALFICFCLGVHFGRYLEREPEFPIDSMSPAEAAVKLAGIPLTDAKEEEQERKIRTALKNQTSIDLVNTPFGDFLDYFRLESGVNCHVDPAAELEIQSNGASRVTCKLSEVTLQRLLDTVLSERKLSSVIRGGVLVIVTQETAEKMLETRVYPVRDLGRAPRYRGPNGTVDPLIEVIQSSIEPSSWAAGGGPASIDRFPNADSLIITQTPGVHDKISNLLAQVRKSRQLQRR